MAWQWVGQFDLQPHSADPADLVRLALQRSDETARLIRKRGGRAHRSRAPCAMGVGAFSGLNLARQLRLSSLQGAALALLGPRVAAAQLFPLAHAYNGALRR